MTREELRESFEERLNKLIENERKKPEWCLYNRVV